jgi:hypothetical protein
VLPLASAKDVRRGRFFDGKWHTVCACAIMSSDASSAQASSAPFESKHTSCMHCWAPAKHRCTQCARATYCSVDCQRAHWKRGHAEWCKRPLETHIHGVPVARVYDVLKACGHFLSLYYQDQRQDKTSPFHPRPNPDPAVEAMMVTDSFERRDPGVWDVASIGSGLAMAEYALLTEHQSRTDRTARLRFLLVDPAPTSWTYGCGIVVKHPLLQPTHASLENVTTNDSWRLRDIMLINYNDGRPYDLLALCTAKPRMLLSVVELCGSAGSVGFHRLLDEAGRSTLVKRDASTDAIASTMSMMGVAYVHLHHDEVVHCQAHPRIADTCLVQVNALRVLTLRGMQSKLDAACSKQSSHPICTEMRQLIEQLRASSCVAKECTAWTPDKLYANNILYQSKLQAADPKQFAAATQHWEAAGIDVRDVAHAFGAR